MFVVCRCISGAKSFKNHSFLCVFCISHVCFNKSRGGICSCFFDRVLQMQNRPKSICFIVFLCCMYFCVKREKGHCNNNNNNPISKYGGGGGPSLGGAGRRAVEKKTLQLKLREKTSSNTS